MNILFCAYRDWAVDAYEEIKKRHPTLKMSLVKSEYEFYYNINEYVWPNIIILVGWSWIVPRNVVDNVYTIGFHPSNLPDYAGGSPIQHQIIDGITQTKGCLFRATSKLDMGPIIYKENLDLDGSMTNIFTSLSFCAVSLVDQFLNNFPDVPNIEQKAAPKTRKRLKPIDSKLTKEKIFNMSSKELYNFIRCREDPYPNVFLEDVSGKLYFKSVEFIPRNKDYSGE